MHCMKLAGLVAALTMLSVQGADLSAYTEELPPLSYTDKGHVTGFSSDLLNAVARHAGLGITQSVRPWARASTTVRNTPDSLLFTTVRTPEREHLYLWVGPIAPRNLLLYRKRGNPATPLRTTGDLARLRTGALFESASARRLQAMGLKPGEELDLAASDEANLEKLLKGRVDLVAMLDWSMLWQLQQTGLPHGSVMPVAILDDRQQYWFALNKHTSPAKVRKLKAGLAATIRSGELAALRQHYGGALPARYALPDFSGR